MLLPSTFSLLSFWDAELEIKFCPTQLKNLDWAGLFIVREFSYEQLLCGEPAVPTFSLLSQQTYVGNKETSLQWAEF